MTDGVNSEGVPSEKKRGLFARFKKEHPEKGLSGQSATVDKASLPDAVLTTNAAMDAREKAPEIVGERLALGAEEVAGGQRPISEEKAVGENQPLSQEKVSAVEAIPGVKVDSGAEKSTGLEKNSASDGDNDAGDVSRFAKLRRVFSRQTSPKNSGDGDVAGNSPLSPVSSETSDLTPEPELANKESEKTTSQADSNTQFAVKANHGADSPGGEPAVNESSSSNTGAETLLERDPGSPASIPSVSGASAIPVGETLYSTKQPAVEAYPPPPSEVPADRTAIKESVPSAKPLDVTGALEDDVTPESSAVSDDSMQKTADPESAAIDGSVPGVDASLRVAHQQSGPVHAPEVAAPPDPDKAASAPEVSVSDVSVPEVSMPREKPGKQERFLRIKQALARTRKGLGRVFLGKKQIDEELLEDLETDLLTADLGFDVTSELIEALTDSVKRKELNDVDALQSALRKLLIDILKPCEVPLETQIGSPFVLLTVGVNGVGKTTTIGKLAKQYLNENKSVILAAGDTFRAAAVEQLQVWGERNQVPVVAQHTGADSASVIFDAVESAKAKGADVLIADTAGRLHTKSNLMDELKKIKRVVGKLDASAPHEVLLVLDAGTGQNAVTQLKQFHEAVGVTGIVLTKLDGTAKGGVIFALCRRFGIPIRFVGVGEGVDDLQPFKAEDFVDALLSHEPQPGAVAQSTPG